MYCRFCGSEFRIWAIWRVLSPNRSNSKFRATGTTIHSSWGTFTFILSFNLDIPRYKFTILRLFNIPPYISLYFEHKQTHCLCGGPVRILQVFGIWIRIALHCACDPPSASPMCHVKQHLAVLALKKVFRREIAWWKRKYSIFCFVSSETKRYCFQFRGELFT